jgi:single-strand DNA-binding protein
VVTKGVRPVSIFPDSIRLSSRNHVTSTPLMSYELEGTLKEVFETKTFGKGFTKREFVITSSKGPDDRYPQHIKLTLIKDKIGLVDRFKPGQRVKITFDIRGNESNGRYYVDLQAWKIEAGEGGGGGAPSGRGGGEGYEGEPPEGGGRDERGGGKRPPRREYDDEDDSRDFGGGRQDGMPF